ncbi:MAG: biopolymer transporter ExbD [Pirellulales bacterium]
MAGEQAAGTPKVINVRGDGTLQLGAETVTLEELTGKLTAWKKQSESAQVFVRGDRETTHGRMADVYAAVRRAGIPNLGIAMKTAETPASNQKR